MTVVDTMIGLENEVETMIITETIINTKIIIIATGTMTDIQVMVETGNMFMYLGISESFLGVHIIT